MSAKRIMDVVIIALSAATIVTLVSAVRRRLPQDETSQGPTIRSIPGWEDYIGGHLVPMGRPNARAVIVEFGDFECPFCVRFAHVLDTVAARVPGGVRLYFRHYPIQKHAYAHAAAIASECAAQQGRFDDFYHLAYKSGKSLSLVLEAEPERLPDSRAFRACIRSPASRRRIAEDSLAAVRLGVTGTPGVLVGNTFIAGTPSAELLDSIIRAQTWK